MRNVNDYACADDSAVEGVLDDEFYDSSSSRIFYDEYRKWGGLGPQIKDDDYGQCLDVDELADQPQSGLPPQP